MSGAPVPSAEGAWIVADMPGGVLGDAAPSIAFAEGRVSGAAGVNRFAGAYAVRGTTLTVGPLAMTRMAGPPARMDQERRLVTALEGPLEMAADGEGLVVTGAAGALRLVPVAPTPSA